MTEREAGEMQSEGTSEGDTVRSAPAGGNVSEQSEQEQLVREIEETREELGDTVDALSQKADVKARVSDKVEHRKAAWRARQEDVKARVSGARERVSGATPDDAKRAASEVARTAEQRPLPAVAFALGLGLLIGWIFGRR